MPIFISSPTPSWSSAWNGIPGKDLLLHVHGQELAGIVTGEPEGRLGQVVGAEREELRLLRDLVCSQAALGSSIMVPTM